MSIFKVEYCPTCKRNVVSNDGLCKRCGSKVLFRGYGARVRKIDEFGREKNMTLTTFRTIKEARQAEANFKAENPNPKRKDSFPYDMTLNHLFKLYIKFKENEIKITSLEHIKRTYFQHIERDFGSKKLIKIDKLSLITWQNSLTSKDYAYSYKVKIRNIFQSILAFACFYYDLPANPFDKLPAFRNKGVKKEMQIWQPEEFALTMQNMPSGKFKDLFFLLYFTGMRIGEAQALQWSDVDLIKKTISITKNLARVNGQPYIITTPKSKSSIRSISIPIPLLEVLQARKERVGDSGFLIGGDRPITGEYAAKFLRKYATLAGVKPIRLHDFRHSHASYLISQGVDIVTVAKRLGHSDIKMTLNTYAHILDTGDYDSIKALDKLNIYFF